MDQISITISGGSMAEIQKRAASLFGYGSFGAVTNESDEITEAASLATAPKSMVDSLEPASKKKPGRPKGAATVNTTPVAAPMALENGHDEAEEETKQVTKAELDVMVRKVVDGGRGTEKAFKVLAQFKSKDSDTKEAKRISDLKEEDYTAVYKALEKVL